MLTLRSMVEDAFNEEFNELKVEIRCEDFLPCTFQDAEDTEPLILSEVEMTRDFGPLKAGEEYPIIIFDFDTGLCQVCKTDGTILHSFGMKLTC